MQWMATETNNVISLYIYYNGMTDRVSDFIIYLNIFAEFGNVEDWDQPLRSSLSGPVAWQKLDL